MMTVAPAFLFIPPLKHLSKVMNVADTENKSFNVLSFCAGYGGLELGLKQAGLNFGQCVYVEREAYAAGILVKAIEAGELAEGVVFTDVETFPAERFRGCFDFIVGGYPCGPFSQIGRRQGAEDEQGRHLWPFFQRAIGFIRPRFCFFENVRGHLTLGFKDVCHDLGELGYEIAAGIFSAAECGASQQRQRVFIFAQQTGTMDNPQFKGLERCLQSSINQKRRKEPTRSAAPSGFCFNGWPEGPKGKQKEWEQPRCVESRLGFTTDGGADLSHSDAGYMGPRENRIERLTMLGNGVVPATAAKAFVTLWQELNPNE